MAVLSEKGISYSGGFFMLIVFAVGGWVLGSTLWAALMVLLGHDVFSLQNMIGQPRYFREIQAMQTLSAFFSFFIPVIFTASRLSSRPWALTGFKGRIRPRQLLFALLIIGSALWLSSALGYLSYQLPFPAAWTAYFSKLEHDYAKLAASLIRLDHPLELIISLIVLAAVPALCEETMFRGGLQNYLYRSTGRLWFSVIVVSLIFSAVHFSFYGFLSRLALGIVLGLLYQFSGRLWLAILAHFVNNAAAVLTLYLQQAEGKSIMEQMSDKEGSYLGFLSIPLLIFLLMKFRQAASSSKPSYGI